MTTFTAEQKLTIVKHLAGGKTAELVATIMKAQPADVVDVARHHGYPDVDKLKWAADIMGKNLAAADGLAERPLAAGGVVTAPRSIGEPGPASPRAHGTLPPVRPDEIRVLINTAKAHPSKKIQTAADRLIDQVNRLKDLINEDQEKNSEKRRIAAEREAARAEVARLEQQLADARAKLRGKPATPRAAAADKPTPTGDYECQNDGCDRTFPTPQGRSLHQRMRCEHLQQAAS